LIAPISDADLIITDKSAPARALSSFSVKVLKV